MSKQKDAGKKDPGFWREVWQQVRLVYYLLRDPEVPFYLKLIPFVAVVYLVWPIDLFADLVPVLGQLDDITALIVTSKVFVELVPPHLVSRHLQTIREQDNRLGFEAEEADERTTIEHPENEVSDQIVIKSNGNPSKNP